jgi:hypothetical protein
MEGGRQTTLLNVLAFTIAVIFYPKLLLHCKTLSNTCISCENKSYIEVKKHIAGENMHFMRFYDNVLINKYLS